MEVYIKSKETLEFLASLLRSILNIPDTNFTEYQRDQKRDSLYYGGEYFLFEVLGLELKLVKNSGEAEIPERSDFSYYVIIDIGDFSNETACNEICKHLSRVIEPHVDGVAVDNLILGSLL